MKKTRIDPHLNALASEEVYLTFDEPTDNEIAEICRPN